jgi:LuxR family maltose regulon positive regulatory protein
LQQGDEWLIRMQISAAIAHAWLAAQRAQLAIAQGNLTAALQWSQTIDVNEEGSLGYLQRLTLVRLSLAQYQREPQARLLTEASQQLADLLGAAERNGWMSHVLEAWLLQALVCYAQGERVAAQCALLRALTLAEPQGYIRTFVDEGEPMRLVLLELRLALARKQLHEAQHLLPYINELLTALGSAQPPKESFVGQPHSTVQHLVEPLTEREIEILRMVNDGLSNSEIAEKLIVTVGTVKKHLNNIFGKLGVGSRTQALVSARVLELL